MPTTIPIWGSLSRKTEGTLDILTTLKDSVGAAPIAATTAEAPKALASDKYLTFDAVVNVVTVTAITAATYWNIHVEVSNAVNGTYTPIGTLRITKNDTARYRVSLFAENAAEVTTNPSHIRVRAELVGTGAGPITYSCYLAKNINMA